MASEWEELEKLSKDELIIELVKERYARRNINQRLRMIVDYDYPVDGEIPCTVEEDDYSCPGYETTDAWARKIIRYAETHRKGDDFGPSDTSEYGLSWDQADAIFAEMTDEPKKVSE